MGTILRLRLAAVPESLPEVRHAAVAALDQARIGDAVDRLSIALALSEAVGNAVRHAYADPASGEVEATVVSDERGVTITVVDQGMGLEGARDGSGQGLGLGLERADTWATLVQTTTGLITRRYSALQFARRRHRIGCLGCG